MTRFQQAQHLAAYRAQQYQAAEEPTWIHRLRERLFPAIHIPDDSPRDPDLWHWAVLVGGFAGLVWLFAMGY